MRILPSITTSGRRVFKKSSTVADTTGNRTGENVVVRHKIVSEALSIYSTTNEPSEKDAHLTPDSFHTSPVFLKTETGGLPFPEPNIFIHPPDLWGFVEAAF